MEGRASREQPLGGGFGRSSRGVAGRRWSGGAVAGRFDNLAKLRPRGSGWALRQWRRMGEPGVWND
jgi:hypothetical protein